MLVPVLLSNGVLLPILGGLWFLTDEESPFRGPGVSLPIVLIVLGIVLFGLGILNGLQLRVSQPK